MDLKRIKTARKMEGLSQTALGAVAGVSGSQICRFEAGKRRLHLDEATKIAKRLKLDLSDIAPEETMQTTLQMPIRSARRNQKTTLPLVEGTATVEYPATLSPRSREALKIWLGLMAKLAERPPEPE